MGASNDDGPNFIYGNSAAIPAAFGGVVNDPNVDAGPSGGFLGDGIIDVRYWFPKDKVQGFTGVVPIHFSMPYVRSVQAVPAALSSSNIAGAQNAVSGTAFTLAAASVGVSTNIPIIPFSASINGNAAVTAAQVLDFGFAFGNVSSGNPTITVSDASLFSVGMPLVIAGVGNAGGTIPLLTNVLSINTATPSITVAANPLASNSATPIGAGNIWGPGPAWYGANLTPTAHMPWLAAGPGLFLDPRQAIARGVQITGSSGAAGGSFTIKGYDIYWQPITITLTHPGGTATAWSTKALKAIISVTPAFSDAHNYTVGTSDVFGINYRAPIWDDLDVTWAGSYMNSSTGFVAGLAPYATASATGGDVRGTIQVSGNGGGSGIGGTATNGTVSSLVMTGNRLAISQTIPVGTAVYGYPATSSYIYGPTQA